MTAFAAMTDSVFNDPNQSLAATYKVGGSGSGQAVRVVIRDPGMFAGLADDKVAVQSAAQMEIRQSDVAAPAAGDTLTIGSTVYTVKAPPIQGDLGLTWKLDVYS